MLNKSLLIICLLLTAFLPILTSAVCCRERAGGQCWDNSNGTPCCGYNKCNAFCCACHGVLVARQEIEVSLSGGAVSISTSVITADRFSTWTCRADHITKYPPKSQCSYGPPLPPDITGGALLGRAPAAAATNLMSGAEKEARKSSDDASTDAANTRAFFYEASGGAENVTPAQYLAWFGFGTNSTDSPRRESVRQKFHLHDVNSDGLLTIEEANLLVN